MSEQKSEKLNSLLAGLSDRGLVSSGWLKAHGYSSSLVSRYIASGWLDSPARGVYQRRGGRLTWAGVVRALQEGDGLQLHVGGRFALAWHGHEHYLRLGESEIVTLYGSENLPGWVGKLPLKAKVVLCGKSPFNLEAPTFNAETTDEALRAFGLEWVDADGDLDRVVFSTLERALLELCDGVSDASLVYEVDVLMQGADTFRPQRVSMLLQHCTSIKAKRLFLALAERHQHAWLAHVSLDGVYLGKGKRCLVPGGHLNSTYQITLPADLDEHLG
ncbi:type IV toxin-antitoxin system AbiEi family antitoxin domain-containing protein [Pseudomonas sp.]|uniref:type IV toxin-antitoxin system AbiEi family antitoxin domain-containing protein n=1 Tax=Pseudomonas sp. TaxID=306 RepID=UPI00299D98B0|nr:type IV toxin-antitoxin system AbiEi family antitoxin domain-containing protein [Pseudomonas sp.]MDX1366500.1 type IV toxin-antitoxin system AbiEi family antitoxin domain-containing protein [Pseudomonas sp.]